MSPMSGTLKPTAERVRSFRDRGDIARSRDAVAAATLGGAVLGLWFTAGESWSALTALVEHACAHPEAETAAVLASRGLTAFAMATVPPLLGACLGALGAIALQLGWPPVLWPRARARRSDAPAPMSQLSRAFGLSAMARRAVTTVAKLAALAVAMTIAFDATAILSLGSPQQLLRALAASGAAALISATLVLLVLGLLDYAWARHRLLGRMKMTHDELRRELRELEGDPAIKARRARRRLALSRQRAADVLETAELVLLAPDEAAIALRYLPGDPAPLVVAKAHATTASVAALVGLARDQDIPIFERPALARALAAHDERLPIPALLYRAVAEVIALARAAPGATGAPETTGATS